MAALPVLVDATSIPPNRGGVARYIAGLLHGLAERGATVQVVVKREDLDWLRDQAPAHDYRAAPGVVSRRPLRLLWEQVALPVVMLRTGARVLHAPHYTFPLVLGRRSVVTLHDATFFSEPGAHGRLKRTFFRTWTRLARSLARATVTPSAATASEIERYAGPSRVPNTVAHLGVDTTAFRPPSPAERAAFAAQHQLDATEGWIAFLGTVEPRKQVGALIEAHEHLRAMAPGVPPLLVAGGLGWDRAARERLEQAGDRPGCPVRYLGYLPSEHLHTLLGGADVVAYPSTGEGFGLPVLEAMACGAAVLTTDRLAIPEVGGDAVHYVEPTAADIERGLSALLADDEERARLGALATERAATFDWAACADLHVSVYAR